MIISLSASVERKQLGHRIGHQIQIVLHSDGIHKITFEKVEQQQTHTKKH